MMEEPNEILNELEFVSPALAAIKRVNVFSVPEGYFADLPGRISTSVFIDQGSRKQAGNVPESEHARRHRYRAAIGADGRRGDFELHARPAGPLGSRV